MAKAGDFYIKKLKESHLGWGTHRYTDSREIIYEEGYIPIPKKYAEKYNLLNSNGTNGLDALGKNLYNCKSVDGLFEGVLKAQGCSKAGDKFAKQFSVNGNLKVLGRWYTKIGAKVGDEIKVMWISSTDIIIEKI